MWRPWIISAAIFIAIVSLMGLSARFMLPGGRQNLAAAIAFVTGSQEVASSGDIATSTTTTPTITDVLQQLQDQELHLSGEVADLRLQAEIAGLKAIFTRILRRGDSGNDVRALQKFLSGSSATAASTTGFYGTLTEKAVRDFQKQAGLAVTGIFDTKTRDDLIRDQVNVDAIPDATPIDLSSVVDPRQNARDLQDQISQLTSEVSGVQTTIADLQDQITSLRSAISDLRGSLSVTASSQLPSSVSAASALIISGVQVSSTTKTSVIITWSTNNPSTSEVDYSQNSSMPANQTTIIKDSSLVTGHKMTISSLASGTTYYYHALSKDSTNSTASTSNLTFTTLR